MILTRNNEYSAVLDTSVLAPMPLCDTLLRRAEEPALFRALRSEESLEEVNRTLQKFGYTENQAGHRLQTVREAFSGTSVAVFGRRNLQIARSGQSIVWSRRFARVEAETEQTLGPNTG